MKKQLPVKNILVLSMSGILVATSACSTAPSQYANGSNTARKLASDETITDAQLAALHEANKLILGSSVFLSAQSANHKLSNELELQVKKPKSEILKSIGNYSLGGSLAGTGVTMSFSGMIAMIFTKSGGDMSANGKVVWFVTQNQLNHSLVSGGLVLLSIGGYINWKNYSTSFKSVRAMIEKESKNKEDLALALAEEAQFEKQIEAITRDYQAIFQLNAAKTNKLKVAIRKEAIQQAKTGTSQARLDITKMLENEHLVSAVEADAFRTEQQEALKATATTDEYLSTKNFQLVKAASVQLLKNNASILAEVAKNEDLEVAKRATEIKKQIEIFLMTGLAG